MDNYEFILDSPPKRKPEKRGKQSKKRKLPLHVIMAINKAQTDENGTPTEPSFRCSICGVYYRPDVMKHYKEHSLSPDIEVCSFCYREHNLGRPVPPHPNTVRYANTTTVRATTLNQQLEAVAAHLAAEAANSAQLTADSELVAMYLEEVQQVSHGHAYVEKFFDRRGRFNQAALTEDFNMFISFS